MNELYIMKQTILIILSWWMFIAFIIGIIGAKLLKFNGWRCGVLWNWSSFWIGCHWSPHNKRMCINPVPCFTFWFHTYGGVAPR